MNILIATDVFPPRCGGSGWSAYYLARGLAGRGWGVTVARPRFGALKAGGQPAIHRVEYEGLPVVELHLPGGHWGREWAGPRRFAALLAQLATETGADLIHGQHMVSIPAAVAAARLLKGGAAGQRRSAGPPVVATVRDYWPLCVYSTGQVPVAGADPPREEPCPRCWETRSLLRCLWAAQGAAGIKQGPGLPLRQWLTGRRRRALGQCAATIAVSHYVAGQLRRGGAVRADRLHVIPNLVDSNAVGEMVAGEPPWAEVGLAPGQPFLAFAGKLEANKGPQLLPAALHAAGVDRGLPVVFAGDGPLEGWLRRAGANAGLDFRFAYLDNADVLRLLARATVHLFPSAWGEPLSRVLLEGLAAGACILALDTGGTPDAISPTSGVLVPDMAAFAGELRALLNDPARRERLRSGARVFAHTRFAESVVLPQVEALYRGVIGQVRSSGFSRRSPVPDLPR